MTQVTPSREEKLRSDLRAAMGELAAGVVMVTTVVDGRPWGLTVSACCSLSMEPPMLLVSLAQTTASAKAILETGCFGVSILGARSLATAQFGSARGAPKFIDRFCEGGDDTCETPAVVGAIAHVDCHVAKVVDGGDHIVFFGDVVNVYVGPESDDPLVYHDRRYHRLTDDSDIGAAPGYLMWW